MGWGGLASSDEAKMRSNYSDITSGDLSSSEPREIGRHHQGFKSYRLGPSVSEQISYESFPIRSEETIATGVAGASDSLFKNWMSANPNDSYRDAASSLGGTLDENDKYNFFIYSPQGRFMGARTTGTSSHQSALNFINEIHPKYLGYSVSGGWTKEGEKFKARQDRLEGVSSWSPEQLRKLDRSQLAKRIGHEFGMDTFGSERDTMFDAIDPFEDSEFGVDIMQAEDSRKLQYGTITSEDMETILDEAKNFDPLTDPEGWDKFKADIEAGGITGEAEEVGSLLDDWFTNIRTGDQRRVTDLERDIKDVSKKRMDKGASDRQALLSEEIDTQERLYGSGLSGMGQSAKSQLRVSDLLATGRQSDFQGRKDLETLTQDLDEAKMDLANQDATLEGDFDASKYEYGDMSGYFQEDWRDELFDQIFEEMGPGIEM